jgi:hypothetical protein
MKVDLSQLMAHLANRVDAQRKRLRSLRSEERQRIECDPEPGGYDSSFRHLAIDIVAADAALRENEKLVAEIAQLIQAQTLKGQA